MQHAMLCLMVAAHGLWLVMLVSLQHIGAPLQRHRPYAPQQWEKRARRWVQLKDLAPRGQVDAGRVVVVEGIGVGACVRVERGSMNWVEVKAEERVW